MSTLKHRPAKRRPAALLSIVLAVLIIPAAFVAGQSTPAELRQAVQQDPRNARAWVDLGDALLAIGQAEEAKTAYLEAIAVDYMTGDAHFGLGLAEYRRGDYQAALFAFSEVSRLYPDRFDGHYNRAVTLARLRMPSESAAAFRDAIDNAMPEATLDDLFNANLGLAAQLKLQEDFGGAADAYSDAIEVFPDDLNVRYLHAEALFLAGRGLEALPLLTVLDAESDDYRVNSLMADVYMEQGQIDYALRSLERAISHAEAGGSAGVQANLFIKLGLLEQQLGRGEDSMTSFRRAASIDPASWQAHYNLGVSYLEAGRFQNSIEPLETAVVLAPASGEARLALATAYDQTGRNADALSYSREALELLGDPVLATQAAFILGRAEYRAGNFRSAATLLNNVVAERPGDPQAQLWAGLAEYQLGNFDNAAHFYERAVQLDPASTEARVNLGAAYLAGARYQDAEFIYSDLVAQNPADATSQYNLGWALLSQNRLTAARDAFQAAADLGYGPAGEALREYF